MKPCKKEATVAGVTCTIEFYHFPSEPDCLAGIELLSATSNGNILPLFSYEVEEIIIEELLEDSEKEEE
jgi:hypothetical protein